MPTLSPYRALIRRLTLPALLGLLLFLLAACNNGRIITNASVVPATISPNADGADDITRISYSIRRPSDVSIYFVDKDGQKHYFRDDRHRGARDYNVLWGGVIDGRVLPDGEYTWVIQATDEKATRTRSRANSPLSTPTLRRLGSITSPSTRR